MDFWLLLVTSALASGIVTNLSSWMLAALKDGKIDKYEWTKGLHTLLFCVVVTASLAFTGLNPIAAGAYSLPISMLIGALKKKKDIPDVPVAPNP